MGVDLAFYCGKYQFYETPRNYPDHDVIKEIPDRPLNESDERPSGFVRWPNDAYGEPVRVIKASDLEKVLNKLHCQNRGYYERFVNTIRKDGSDPDIYLYWH